MKTYRFHDLELEPALFRLSKGGVPVKLEPQVFEVLHYLVRHRDRVVTKEELLDRLWEARFVGDSVLTRTIYEVRRALGDDSRSPRLIATVHGRGYRFVAPVEEVTTEPPRDAEGEISAMSTPAQKRLRPGVARAALLGTAGVAALLAVGVGMVALDGRRAGEPRASEPGAVRLALLPIAPSAVASEDQRLQAVSLTDLLYQRLRGLEGLVVRSPDASASQAWAAASLEEAAAQLGVQLVVSGTLEAGALPGRSQLEIFLHDFSGAGGHAVLLGRYDVPSLGGPGSAEAFVQLRDRVTLRLVETLAPALPLGAEPETAPREVEAYLLYLRARDLLGQPGCKGLVVLELLERSLERDPLFAPAWEALGWANYGMVASCGFSGDYYERALEAADRTLELAPDWLPGVSLKSTVLVESGRIEDAYGLLGRHVKEARRAPDLAFAIAYVLTYAGFFDEAQRWLAVTLETDPLFLTARGWTPNVLLYRDDFEGFLELLPGTESPLFRYYRGFALLELGRSSEALAALEPAFRANPTDNFARLAFGLYAIVQGRGDEGAAELQRLAAQRASLGGSDGELTFKIAQLLVRAGRPDEGLVELERTVAQGFFCSRCILADPRFEPLWGEERFRTVVEAAQARHQAFGRRFGLIPEPLPEHFRVRSARSAESSVPASHDLAR